MEAIKTDNGPEAIGPYSQAIAYKDLVFISGQIPINPATGNIEGSTIEEQSERVLKNLEAILDAAGSSFSKTIKCTVFLSDMNHFASFNSVYAKKFGEKPPARSTVQVARLPRDVKIEIDAIAFR